MIRVSHRLPFGKADETPQPFAAKDVLPRSGKSVRRTCWYAPLDHLQSTAYLRVQVGHFFLILFSSWLAVQSSLMIGATFGDLTGITPPNIGVYSILAGLAHLPPLYIAFNVRTWRYYDVRINPYISLCEWALHGAIGFWACVIEVAAQALGAVTASAFTYGVLNNSPLFINGVGGTILNTGVGWAFFLELFSGFFMGLVYFHNWAHERSVRFATTMAYAVTAGTIVVFPFIGPTTHNPFRWLAACVIESSCGSRGSWIYPVGPLAGVILGYIAHLITWKIV